MSSSGKDAIKVSGKRFELGAADAGWKFEQRPGGWWVASRARPDGSLERLRVVLHERKGRLSASVGGQSVHGEIQQASRAGTAAAGGDSDLVAQFPGKVRKVLVAAGASVKEGDALVMVEAMKMEFSVKAPRDARVKAVLVKEGQQLSPGDRFVELE